MDKSVSSLRKSPFNAIYVEEAAYSYPMARLLLQKHAGCPVIPIRHYKDVFNRKNQHFGLQKQYPSLILAVKEPPFLYKGPAVCQNFGHAHFYYASFVVNCIFDCEYCYLQGMYPSANPVAFVNVEDFRQAVLHMAPKEPVYLAASYDTDLIAFQPILPYLDYFYDFFAGEPRLLVEIRTKSAHQAFYKAHRPSENVIIAFTLSPEGIIQKYERRAPPLEARLQAVETAIAQGYKVRLCFDPIFIHPEADGLYAPFYRHVFARIDPGKIADVGYGFFRMSGEFFKRMEKKLSHSQLFSEEYCVHDNVVSYAPARREETHAGHLEILTRYIDKERIFSL